MTSWPPLTSYQCKSHTLFGTADTKYYSYFTTCDVDAFRDVDIYIFSQQNNLDGFETEVEHNLEVLRRALPAILDYLAGPSAWSFNETLGMNVSPNDVCRKLTSLSISFDDHTHKIRSRSLTVQCELLDKDIEPNFFCVDLDDHGEVVNAQLND